MRILMRNTVFKTAALAGLFLCMLAFGGAFFGITASVHATDEGFIHADEVGTDKGKLQEFVEAAIDAFYIDFLIKKKCDFSDLGFTPALVGGLSTELIKSQISLFASQIQGDIGDYCTEIMSFDQVFGRGDGNWRSGPIYLFIMDDQREMLYNGANQNSEGMVIEAIDRGDRDVAQLIIGEAGTPTDGFVEYCWDDPTVEGDNEPNANSMMAPGFSWKISYVVDPFEHLGLPAPSDSPGVIFGSGIYPKTGTPEEGCEIVTDGETEPMEPPMEPMEPPMEPTEPMEPPMEPMEPPMDPEPTSVSGGGCAIAGGGDSTPRNNALNLLLMVSTLFLAVSFGNRAAGRRNAIRS